MMYVWNDGGKAVYERSKERAAAVYGITREPDAEFADGQLLENSSLIRVTGGKIVLGWTEEELALQEASGREQEIRELKGYLSGTDYVAVKIAEGAASADEYSEVLAKRAEARLRINELEAQDA